MTYLVIFGLFGLAYGIVLQRSGFCFAKVGFELCLLHTREAFYGVLAAIATAAVGFAVVSALRLHAGLDPQTHLLVIPFGVGTVVGGALFGLGMTLAGMCAAGTLLRLGEGYAIAGLSLLGIVLGAAFDPFRSFVPEAWKTQAAGLWLGGRLGLVPATAATLLLVFVLGAMVARGQRGPRVTARSLLTPPVIGGVVLGVVNTLQVAYATPWTVGYPLGLISRATTLTEALPLLVLNAGLVVGALAATAAGGRYRLKWPRRRKEMLMTLAGGVLMGWGIQLARGCSIGGAFSALASLSLSAWLFLPALLFGTWVGTQVVRRTG